MSAYPASARRHLRR